MVPIMEVMARIIRRKIASRTDVKNCQTGLLPELFFVFFIILTVHY